MNTAKLKSFAPACRIALIKQVGVKLDYVLTAKTPDLAEKENLLNELRRAMKSEGREALIERVAYTWFNRFAAFRYLDARNWHPFKKRLITSAKAEEVLPELLQQVCKGVLPDELKPFVPMDRVNNLLDKKLASTNPQAEVQRLLVIGVSQYYADLQPGLFNKIDAFTELLLPDDLLTEHSVAEGFRTEITDADCLETDASGKQRANVEILGWLYQFYISEKKDSVMARKSAVPTEDIPAVTQLFTPHWIVRYLVENSLGRLWLLNRPGSRLREHMPYYIEGEKNAPGSSPDDFLKITKPEEIRLCDPAVGSGHMLTYAFDLLTLIYEEEGYAPSDIPGLILRHNLHGLEICPRAAQLAELALVFKAREKSRRFFQPEHLVRPRIIELRDVRFAENELRDYIHALGLGDLFNQPMLRLLHQFEEAKNFGSLIQPCLDERAIAFARRAIEAKDLGGQLFLRETHLKVLRVLDQAEALTQRYHVVVANPPYMGGKGINANIKDFLQSHFADYKSDLFAAFIFRCLRLAKPQGLLGFMSPFVWMFLSSYEELRRVLTSDVAIRSLVRPEYHSFFESAFVPICAFTLSNGRCRSRGDFFDLSQFYGADLQPTKLLEAIRDADCGWRYQVLGEDFRKIPGTPIAFSVSDRVRETFAGGRPFGEVAEAMKGLDTCDNDRFVRFWPEVSLRTLSTDSESPKAAQDSGRKWFPYCKGGDFRRWAGNMTFVVDWANDGQTLKGLKTEDGRQKSRPQNVVRYFSDGITFSSITSSLFSGRKMKRAIFGGGGSAIFAPHVDYALGLLNSKLNQFFMGVLNPTLNMLVGDIEKIPFLIGSEKCEIEKGVALLVKLSETDWENFETSWDFRDQPLLRPGLKGATLEASWRNWEVQSTAAIRRMQELETENNRLFIAAYGLDGELQPEVPEAQITLARAEARRDMAAFLSYAVGCMMGRYSLDHPGLILADAGDTVEHYLAKVGKPLDELQFPPDEDAIIPVLEGEWFEDDAAARMREFLKITFGPETLEENLAFIKEALGRDLRKYFTANAGGFYADHVQTYKKRPIYWMFESPKKHFRALVYLHRYTKDTVNTLLNGYLREFRHKLTHRRDQLEGMVAGGSATTADRKALKTTLEAIKDVEIYEREILLPLAQQRLEIDLDDGVKVNYLKFGKALAKITGLS